VTVLDRARSTPAASANVAVYDALENESYIDEAPHLKHESLRQLYAQLTAGVLARLRKSPAEIRVLDLGAGEGSVTLRFLELGSQVTAVDSSERQLSYLRSRAAAHSDRLAVRRGDVFEVLRDEKQSEETFDLIISNSFLHHIPDYQQLVSEASALLNPDGILFTFQDPLRFSSLKLPVRAFTGAAYLAWRVTRPDVVRGLGRRIRRMFGLYRPDCPEDNAEYHVVRDGVDQDMIARILREAGMKVEVVRYFSTQSPLWQRLGRRLGISNTFAVIAQRQH
jgi:2-polyprenyl-3-methyl-5-hydroxy-6-metoxy-1,4-benzoquinol methylase